mgnify:CR=1 FL=1
MIGWAWAGQAEAEKYISGVVLKDKTARVVIAGSRLDVLTAVHYVISLGISGNRITVALVNTLSDIIGDENILGKMLVEFGRAGITVLDIEAALQVDSLFGDDAGKA